jgi:hypothetical protein
MKPLGDNSDDDEDDDNEDDYSATPFHQTNPAKRPGSIEISFRGARSNKRRKIIAKMEDIENEHLNALFLDYIIDCQLPFRQCEKKSFRNFVAYLNPHGEKMLPLSHSTVAERILERYRTQKDSIKILLRTAITKIHVSCDAWTSGGTAFLGITARFANSKGRQQLVLAIKNIRGSHSGANMAEIFLATVQEYEIEKNLGFCCADNASNNDTMCTTIEKQMGNNGISWDAKLYRLRCLAHISNLAVQALLFGKHPNTQTDPELPSADDLRAWRKLGTLGKLHEIIIWIYHSPQRREAFLGLSKGVALRRDNKTRWTSWFECIMRALELRGPLDTWGIVIQADKTIKKDDMPPYLNEEDWITLKTFGDILLPYKDVTIATEGYGDSLNCTLIGLDLLLDSVEEAKANHRTNAIFATALETSWNTLEKYYILTDESPAYAAAIVLDPRHKWSYFKQNWTTPIQLACLKKAKIAVNCFFLIFDFANILRSQNSGSTTISWSTGFKFLRLGLQRRLSFQTDTGIPFTNDSTPIIRMMKQTRKTSFRCS